LVIWLTVNDRKDDAASLASHAQLTASARKAIDEDVARVRGAWRDRRSARDAAADAPRAVALSPSAAGVARTATPAITTQS
ncbi:hypothetical protein KC220_26880, partial [Mycobacterium tuberculosis]|nr:hypothetical protein [Mycobacterium tuberculosis]